MRYTDEEVIGRLRILKDKIVWQYECMNEEGISIYTKKEIECFEIAIEKLAGELNRK